MKKKNVKINKIDINLKKGITSVSVVATIAIMLILLSGITVSVSEIVNSTKKKRFASEIYSIQKMVEEYYFKNNKYPIADTLTNEIDLYELGVNEVSRGLKKNNDTSDIYVVDEGTGEVKYIKGVKIGGKEYYSLEDNDGELKKELGFK